MAVLVSKWLRLVVAILTVWQTSAWINGGDSSKSFEQCFSIHQKGSENAHFTQGVYEQFCTDLLLPIDSNNKRIGNFTEDQMQYIQNLFRKVYSELYSIGSKRVRRHSDGGMERYRAEIRASNGKYFDRYANAVLRIKQTGEYDTIAAIHSTVVKTAHFGPNLLPWHRLYLLIMETALGVPIPYWDATLDFNMKDPTKSFIWTGKFFGTAIGKVTTGPFKKFSTPAGPLFRKVNAFGSLFSREDLRNVLSQRHLADIVSPLAKPKNNLEGQHNSVHAYVNGIMGNIALSSYDPIFFTFHSFLDYIWDLFRVQQSVSGVAAEFDLVKTKQKGQSPDDESGIKGFINRDGYTDRIARFVAYRPWPVCSYCDGSPILYCDKHLGACVSKEAPWEELGPARPREADYLADVSGLSAGKFGPPFAAFRVDPRVRGDPVQPTRPLEPIHPNVFNGAGAPVVPNVAYDAGAKY